MKRHHIACRVSRISKEPKENTWRECFLCDSVQMGCDFFFSPYFQRAPGVSELLSSWCCDQELVPWCSGCALVHRRRRRKTKCIQKNFSSEVFMFDIKKQPVPLKGLLVRRANVLTELWNSKKLFFRFFFFSSFPNIEWLAWFWVARSSVWPIGKSIGELAERSSGKI